MLPKRRRIPKSYFPYLLKVGQKTHTAHIFLCAVNQNKENIDKISRFSFSVSKKVSKSAVLRNKLRRRGYSIIKKHLEGVADGKLYLFSYKKDANKLKFSDIEQEIMMLLSKYTVLK